MRSFALAHRMLVGLLLLALAALGHCGLVIERLQRLNDAPDELAVVLQFQPDPEVIDALDASVELKFKLSVRESNVEHATFVTLRFARMLNRYEMEMAGSKRYFRLKAELFDAFSALVLSDATNISEVRMQLDLASLPSALRLPALLDRSWRLDSGWVAIAEPAL